MDRQAGFVGLRWREVERGMVRQASLVLFRYGVVR